MSEKDGYSNKKINFRAGLKWKDVKVAIKKQGEEVPRILRQRSYSTHYYRSREMEQLPQQ